MQIRTPIRGCFKTLIGVFICILMFLVTFTSALIYLVTQQSLRLGANELPAQLV